MYVSVSKQASISSTVAVAILKYIIFIFWDTYNSLLQSTISRSTSYWLVSSVDKVVESKQNQSYDLSLILVAFLL